MVSGSHGLIDPSGVEDDVGEVIFPWGDDNPAIIDQALEFVSILHGNRVRDVESFDWLPCGESAGGRATQNAMDRCGPDMLDTEAMANLMSCSDLSCHGSGLVVEDHRG